jgi:Holliday junction DNA helicase RuvA
LIAYVNGIIEYIEEGLCVVDVGGIGMNVFISGSTMDRMPGIGEAVKLYTYTSVKEDSFTLYGFLSRDELSLFKMLITVNGIGPKGGLSILSVMTPDDLRFAIMAGDSKSISAAPGIGKKTAQRIVLELKDKVEQQDVSGTPGAAPAALPQQGAEREAQAALQALGYTAAEAAKAISAVRGQASETDQLIMLALRQMSQM